MKFLKVTFLVLIFSLISFSQTNNKSENFRLVQTKPSAYITFEKFVTREPRFIGESSERILLRFYNNTKWNLTINTLACRTIQEECLVFYEVERRYGDKSEIKKSDVPSGYRMAHISSVMTIPSGNSVRFSLPKEHLAEGLYIIVEFSYEWEAGGNGGNSNGYIFHKAPFYSTDLPKKKSK